MQLETFRGRELRSVVSWITQSMGDDAMIVDTNLIHRPEGDYYEVLVAPPEDLAEYRRKLSGGPILERIATRKGAGPYVVALVGPPGAGKTTAAMKIALHPNGVGSRKVGLLTLDTYRVGAVDEMQTYAEIAGLPLEVVYHVREVEAAMERLQHLDAVVIDTPGRARTDSGWGQALRKLAADEVHLVLPASLRDDVAGEFKNRLSATGITHALFTKLDEVPGDVGLAALAGTLELPVRWIGDGYEVPGKLSSAGSRIVRSLGKRAAAPVLERQVV